MAPSVSVTFLPMEAVGEDGTIELGTERALSDVREGYSYFRDGDVSFAKITPCFENGKGALMRGLANGIGFGTTELIVARPNAGIVAPEFLFYIFASEWFRNLGESRMYGAGGQKRIPEEFARDFVAALPATDEQAVISAFLDRETAKVDKLVEEQRRLIALLDEKRQAVVSHAVTKGLHPQLKMKESGVDVFGSVPSHWSVVRVKACCETTSGGTPSTALQDLYYADALTGTPWIRTTDLQDGPIDRAEVFITEEALRDSACEVLPPGTVLVSMYGGETSIGKCGLLRIPAAINQALCGLLPSPSLSPRFLLWFLQFYKPYWMVGAESSRKDPNISQERVRNSHVLLPPRAEQDAIVAWLDAVDSEVRNLTSEATAGIALLLERRSALITAAVTGQIDVRALEPSEAP